MFAAIVICSAPPFIIEKIKKPSWVEEHPDEVLLDLDEDKTASTRSPARSPARLAAATGSRSVLAPTPDPEQAQVS